MRKFGVASLFALVAMLTFGGADMLHAATHNVKRSASFSDSLTTTDNTTQVLTRLQTAPGTIYLIEIGAVARSVKGGTQQQGYGKHCYCVVQVLSDGSVQPVATECEGVGGLTVTQDPVCANDSSVITVTVRGNASTTITWLGEFHVQANATPNQCQPSGEFCASNSDCCSPLTCQTGSCAP